MSTRTVVCLLTSITACHLEAGGLGSVPGDDAAPSDAPVLDAGADSDAPLNGDAGRGLCARCDDGLCGSYVCVTLRSAGWAYCLPGCDDGPCPADLDCVEVRPGPGVEPVGRRVCVPGSLSACAVDAGP